MKIQFIGNLKELNGEDVVFWTEIVNMGKWLWNQIASSPQWEPITAIQRANKIYNNEILDLNTEEINKLIVMINKLERAPALFIAQILQVIEDAKIGDKLKEKVWK